MRKSNTSSKLFVIQKLAWALACRRAQHESEFLHRMEQHTGENPDDEHPQKHEWPSK